MGLMLYVLLCILVVVAIVIGILYLTGNLGDLRAVEMDVDIPERCRVVSLSEPIPCYGCTPIPT